jgi:hypothetical protein
MDKGLFMGQVVGVLVVVVKASTVVTSGAANG